MVFIIRAGAHSLAWHLQIKIMRRLAQICFFYLARNGWFYWYRSRQVFRGPSTEERLIHTQYSLTLSNTFYADKEKEMFTCFHGLNLSFQDGTVTWPFPPTPARSLALHPWSIFHVNPIPLQPLSYISPQLSHYIFAKDCTTTMKVIFLWILGIT